MRASSEDLPVDGTLRRIVLLFRVLGWVWMAILVVLTLISDSNVDVTVAGGALVMITGWTAFTIWTATTSDRMRSTWFVLSDIAIALLAGAATTLSGAADLFHGGYPMSTLAVTAYAFNLRATLAAALLLTVEQVVVHVVDGRGVLPAVGSIVFIVFAIMLGWAFDQLRLQERRRLEVQEELDEANTARVRHEERLDLANRLHDSVLQTLTALRRDADDPSQVRYLSRRQERQLRSTISEYRSPHPQSTRAAIQGMCDEVEDIYRIEIDSIIRGDAEVDGNHEMILAAAREALINAVKHSGVNTVDLYAELADDRVQVFVRDRGRGFDPATVPTGRGLDHSLRGRAEAVNAVVNLTTEPGAGTEVEILWEPR